MSVMKQGRGSTDATLPRAINQTASATEPVQIGLISLGIKHDIKVQVREERVGEREGESGRQGEGWGGGWDLKKFKYRPTLYYYYTRL